MNWERQGRQENGYRERSYDDFNSRRSVVSDPYRKSYSRDKFFSNKALESDIRGSKYTSRFDIQRAEPDQGFDSDKYHKQLSSAKDKFRFELEEDDFIK